MAYVVGQLDLPSVASIGIPMLRKAADLANIDSPWPAYLYGLILANEALVSIVSTSPHIIPPLPDSLAPSPGTPLFNQYLTARQYIGKAAFLCHPPAQYKLGSMYEHATLSCPYDPRLSVEWYTLASQGGAVEANMALSKWYLCGAEGYFPKDEQMAREFAGKAALAGLSSGLCAMGYYCE